MDKKMTPLDPSEKKIMTLEKSYCSVCDSRKRCSVCKEQTLMACSDCRIDLNTSIYVCNNISCQDIHENKCPGTREQDISARPIESTKVYVVLDDSTYPQKIVDIFSQLKDAQQFALTVSDYIVEEYEVIK